MKNTTAKSITEAIVQRIRRLVSVTVLLHQSYGKRSILIVIASGLVDGRPLTCPHDVLRHAFELNVPAADEPILKTAVVLSHQFSALTERNVCHSAAHIHNLCVIS